jgi:hypothetical protein
MKKNFFYTLDRDRFDIKLLLTLPEWMSRQKQLIETINLDEGKALPGGDQRASL